ncbi:MAG: cytochrome c biogenesis protein ResB, partial [Bacteroidota bacterium]
MNRFVSRLQPYLFALLNTRAAGLYILLFAIAIGAATFIENDFGTSAAQKVIYQTWWFESLLFLFGASIVYNIFKFRMIPQKKWSLLMFHSAIIVILIGAGVTRYFGYEGMMHIREGTSNDRFLSREMYLSFEVDNGAEEFAFAEQVLFASLGSNDWQESYLLGNDEIKVEVKDFIPNPKPVLYESLDGKPTVQMVIAGAQGREEYFLQAGDRKRIRGGFFNFTPERLANAINIWYRNDSLLIQSDRTMSQIVMASQQKDTLRGSAYHPLRLRSLYNDGQNNFVFADFKASGNARIESTERKDKNESVNAVVLQVSANGQSEEVFLYGRKGAPGKPQQIQLGGLQVQAAYGAQEIELPFAIGLYDFEMERYPGTNSPASYASEVQLIDSRSNHKEDFRIYMNNILNYEGYRFFQSSYDQDEKGTYLSVNHDAWGTWISYLGYALLTLGMILTLISKRTRFHQVNKQLKKMRAEYATVFVLFALGLGFQDAQASVPREEQIISQEHAADFSRVIVQDFKGRMKPVHTLSREIMRKVHRKESFQGFSADQVLLSMFARPKDWYGVEIIKLGKHPDLERKLGLSGKYAAYKDFFHQSGEYKLRQEMARVQQLAPIDRGTFEKELLKIDERVNILNMVFSGHLLRLVPRQNDPSNTWEGPHQQRQDNSGNQSSGLAERFFQSYRQALTRALEGHGYTDADALLAELDEYQRANGGEVLPSDTQRNAELMLNQFNVFNRLMGVYMLLGIGFLSCLFLSVFKPSLSLKRPFQILFGLAALGFLAHTIGLGLRWYVSERAPWSNGYESMIYIAW